MSADHDYWVYMVSSKTRSTLYIGMTDNLERRVAEHRAGEVPGFTQAKFESTSRRAVADEVG